MRKVKERVLKQQIQRTSFTRTVKQIEKECPVCHRHFWGAKISLYCSRTCRNKAHYGRHVDEYRQARMEAYRRQKAQATKG